MRMLLLDGHYPRLRFSPLAAQPIFDLKRRQEMTQILIAGRRLWLGIGYVGTFESLVTAGFCFHEIFGANRSWEATAPHEFMYASAHTSSVAKV